MKTYIHPYSIIAGILLGLAASAVAQREVPGTPLPPIPPQTTPLPVPTTPAVSSTQTSAALRLLCQNDGTIRVEVVPK